jgi:hypothetical protein
MSEVNDNKYIKPLVNTESNNNQYQLINNQQNQNQTQNPQPNSHAIQIDTSNDSDEFIQQKGGENNVPSLKEIYNQQKMYSPSVKQIPITASENRKDYRKSEGKINIVIPANQASQINQNQYQNQKNMNSETSQAYHNQEGAVEEEFSNMKDKRSNMSNMKSTLNPISEHDTSQTESNKNKVYNYRKF